MKKQVKHTPGEWIVDGNFIQTDDYIICEVYSKNNYSKHPKCDQDIPDIKNGEANARLIASAPELLEACNRIQKLNGTQISMPSHEYQILKQVIAKSKETNNKKEV